MPATHAQETCTRNWNKSSCTRNLHVCRSIWYKFLARNWAQIYSRTETRNVTRTVQRDWPESFYRAMHFSAKRGIAIARLFVCPSVCLSVCLSVTLVNCDHISWNSSKIISSSVSLGCSLFATPTWRVCSKGNTPKFWPKVTHPLLIWASETFDRKLRPNGYR